MKTYELEVREDIIFKRVKRSTTATKQHMKRWTITNY